eukprot:TRINITY_DN9036_c0_g1_i1.p1 TRINITY_DN9036_c0_g1~~TRINITY_DN9036_c0_g1_i1.p1  ORF type:complete len:336 (+),score=41.93 TRINITY_DN9036_c0_g1_i1:21-1028(+)
MFHLSTLILFLLITAAARLLHALYPLLCLLPYFFVSAVFYYDHLKKKSTISGCLRLLLFMGSIAIWTVFVFYVGHILASMAWSWFSSSPHSFPSVVASLFPFHSFFSSLHWLFGSYWMTPYLFSIMCIIDSEPHMDMFRGRLVNFFFDFPTMSLVYFFAFVGYRLNKLYTPIDKKQHVLLGAMPFSWDVSTLSQAGVKGVINMCFEYNGPIKQYTKYGIEQLHLPTFDINAPSRLSIEKALQFIREHLKQDHSVFIHCKAGMGRSATIAFCHLVCNEGMTEDEAFTHLKSIRPEVAHSVTLYSTTLQVIESYRRDRARANNNSQGQAETQCAVKN